MAVEIKDLKNKFIEEKRKRKAAVDIANTLQDRYNNVKEKLAVAQNGEFIVHDI